MKYLAALALLYGCISPVIAIGGSPKDAERSRLAELLPPQLDMTPRWTGAMRVARIRVWADADFRAQNLRWRDTFGEELAYANAVLEPTFGLHLIADYREWDFRAPPGSQLDDVLQVLAQHDPGDDVLSVVGLVSSLSLVSATFEELGRAESPGNHVVLRGYAGLAERAMFERAFPKLSADELDAALEARRRHKTTLVLLHELVHNLGAPHDADPETIMNAVYSDHAARFSSGALELAIAGLDARMRSNAIAAGPPPMIRPPPIAVAPTGGASGTSGTSGDAPPPTLPPPTLPSPRRVQHASLIVVLAGDGSIYVGHDPVDLAGLDARLRAAAAADPDTRLAVQVMPASSRDLVVRIVDRAKQLGMRDVSMIVTN